MKEERVVMNRDINLVLERLVRTEERVFFKGELKRRARPW